MVYARTRGDGADSVAQPAQAALGTRMRCVVVAICLPASARGRLLNRLRWRHALDEQYVYDEHVPPHGRPLGADACRLARVAWQKPSCHLRGAATIRIHE